MAAYSSLGMVKLSRTSFGFLAFVSRTDVLVSAGFAAAFLRAAGTFLGADADWLRDAAFLAEGVAPAVSGAVVGAAAGWVEEAAETSIVVGMDADQKNGIYSLYRFTLPLAFNGALL